MTNKDIEKMLLECDGLDMSHVKKDDALAKARQEMYFGTESAKEDIAEKKEKSKSPLALLFGSRRFVSAFAGAALALLLCFGMIGLYNENFQTLYIDINPSVALKLNRFERVIGVEFLNEDAKALLSDVKLVGSDAEEALKTVIDACNSAGYVKEDSEIYISASANKEQTSEKLLGKLKGTAESMREDKGETYAVNTYSAKKGEKKDFEKESISPAKYRLIEEIIDDAPNYTFEDLKDKKMDELRRIERELDDDDDDFDFDDDDRDDRDEHDDDDHEGKGNKNDNNGKNDKNEKPDEKPDDKPDDKPNNRYDDDDDDDDRDDDDRDDGKSNKGNKPDHDD